MRVHARAGSLSVLSGLLCAIICMTPVVAKAELKVGFIGGFSGSGQVFGDAARNGFEFAREEFGTDKLVVFYEDDQFDPKRSVAAFNKLVHQDKVDVLIILGSTPASALAPLAERQGIPLLAWASARHVALGRRWVIRTWASGEEEGSAIATKASELDIKKLASLVYSDQYADAVLQGVKAAFKSEVLALGEVQPTEQDFSTFILRAKNAGADGIFACLACGQGALLAKQARKVQFNVPILGCEVFNSADEVKLSDGALSGAWYASVPVSADFSARLSKRFRVDAALGGSAIHYELYRILAEIAPSNPSREQLMERLLTLSERDSVVGRFESVREDGDQWFRLPVAIQRIP